MPTYLITFFFKFKTCVPYFSKSKDIIYVYNDLHNADINVGADTNEEGDTVVWTGIKV